MATDEISRETAEVQFEGLSGGFDGLVDVGGQDMLVSGEGSVEVASEGEDLWDSPCEGLLDRVMGVENGVVMDDGAFRAISLIGEGESGYIGQEEEYRARVEW